MATLLAGFFAATLSEALARFGKAGQRMANAGQDLSQLPHDRSAMGRVTLFGTKARQMNRAEQRAMVERENPALPIAQQCRLLVSRAAVHRSRSRSVPRISRSWR
jgi:hypothetical protein